MVSLKLIETLFGGGCSQSVAAFPLRAVYMLSERQTGDVPVQLLISVPKKRFKHAVDRNRVKRQIRECYRRQKQLLIDRVNAQGQTLAIALIWQANRLYPTHEVSACVEKLLKLLEKRCWA